jgi:septum formation protein
MRLILASGSPRRSELLARLGYPFEVIVPDIDETAHIGEDPAAYVERLAREKALAVDADGAVVIAADTTVVVDGDIVGKPLDAADAAAMLRRIAGRDHVVLTGMAVRSRTLDGTVRVTSIVDEARLTVTDIGDDEIDAYLATGEPFDKAGGYAMQGIGSMFISRVEGNPTTVIGLPLAPLREMLRAL